MTWVLGWPLEIDWAIEYSKKRNLCEEGTEDIESLYHAAGFDITRRLGVPADVVPVLACWDDDDLKAIYALCIDKKAKSAATARKRISKLPPRRVAFRLGKILGIKEAPKWYEYDGGRPYDSDYSDSDSSEEEDSAKTVAEPATPTKKSHSDSASATDHCDQTPDAVAEGAYDPDVTPRMHTLEIVDFVDKAVQVTILAFVHKRH
ncbi:hypothetical protein CERSUDRAFT_123191 [Gelatoporia subvermispora B]|uniref:Uncharacterized protein n=1 Tax=Ceriporiopsis subvermispora (strain B) TaxID=914234 RepID=M2RJH9_CERS8|nr:hypothetical protein CERSUDRAFT_123191 [Gelatoporia subvermispora B]